MKSILNLVVLDNGGETFDRYTIIDRSTGDMVGASNELYIPTGFGQHCGNVAHNYWVTAYGHGWDRVDAKTLRKRVKYAVDLFLSDCSNVGEPLPFKELPENVQRFAREAFIN
mgnify:FL=1